MSVLTDTEQAAYKYADEHGGYSAALHEAFLAGAAYRQQWCADYIRQKADETYGSDATLVEFEEAALWLEEHLRNERV